jgi:hypothetical protein
VLECYGEGAACQAQCVSGEVGCWSAMGKALPVKSGGRVLGCYGEGAACQVGRSGAGVLRGRRCLSSTRMRVRNEKPTDMCWA